jgi:excinuclease ABC subunit B
MYADKETDAMRKAISETDRRREIQVAYNLEHDITPATVKKGISDMAEFLAMESAPKRRSRTRADDGKTRTPEELEKILVELEEEMLAAAEDLRFEQAARIRDELKELRRDLEAIRA